MAVLSLRDTHEPRVLLPTVNTHAPYLYIDEYRDLAETSHYSTSFKQEKIAANNY